MRPADSSPAANGPWANLFRRRLQRIPVGTPHLVRRDDPLEGLRGLCALAVFVGHASLPAPALDPLFSPPAVVFDCLNLGFPAVLMFFVLSGYVIGLTTKEPFTLQAGGRYLGRRARRLLPVVYAAILLTWVLHPSSTPPTTVAGHALFLQNLAPYPLTGWRFPLLDGNNPLWTLNYEALYYVAFLGVWWLRPPVTVVAGALVLVPVAAIAGVPFPTIINRYAYGACYWLTGLTVAWLTPDARGPNEAQPSPWPSALLGSYALWNLAALRGFFYQAGNFIFLDSEVVSLHRLDFLAGGLWVLLAITGRSPKLERGVAVVCLVWGWIGVGRALIAGETSTTVAAGGVAILLATVLVGWRQPLTPLARLAPLGAISFGLYVVASPLQIAMRNTLFAFSGSAWTYVGRFLVLLGTCVGVAWLLDWKLSRWIAQRYRAQLSCSPPQRERQSSTDDH